MSFGSRQPGEVEVAETGKNTAEHVHEQHPGSHAGCEAEAHLGAFEQESSADCEHQPAASVAPHSPARRVDAGSEGEG